MSRKTTIQSDWAQGGLTRSRRVASGLPDERRPTVRAVTVSQFTQAKFFPWRGVLRKDGQMSGASHRWQGPKSDFPWEEDALRHIKGPDAGRRAVPGLADVHVHRRPPATCARSTCSSRPQVACSSSRSRATPAGPPTTALPGCSATSGRRTIENPLHFTDLKAKELQVQLEQAAKAPQRQGHTHSPHRGGRLPLRDEPEVRPRRVPAAARLRPRRPHRADRAPRHLERLPQPAAAQRAEPRHAHPLQAAGEAAAEDRHRSACTSMGKVGPYELEPRVLRRRARPGRTTSPVNPALPDDQIRRVRIYLSELGATEGGTRVDPARRATASTWRSRASPTTASSAPSSTATSYDAGPAVVFRHGKDWQRLDQFMAAHANDLPIDTRLEMIRQLAEALDHAHRRHLYHRALAPAPSTWRWTAATRGCGSATGRSRPAPRTAQHARPPVWVRSGPGAASLARAHRALGRAVPGAGVRQP